MIKLGTITTGQLTVVDHNLDDEVLNVIANIEENSIHPLAKAIVNYVIDKAKFKKITITDIEEISGQGIKGKFNNDIFNIGKPIYPENYLNFLENGETVLSYKK